MPEPGPIPFLTGPTAVGKTGIAVRVAERIGAEIVSADSRQVYREFGLAVDKPSGSDRSRVPHHLVDSHSVHSPISAWEYARQAESRIADIRSRGLIPLVVGGSTLYIEALVTGLANIPEVSESIRQQVRSRLAVDGNDQLYRELQNVDPTFAATLDSTKTQRLLRGLEVHAATGRPLSSYFNSGRDPAYYYNIVIMNRSRDELYRRIDERVENMVEMGLLDEAKALLASGVDLEANPTRTIGYAEAAARLRGDIDDDALIALVQRNSRRYAKRQLTWLRRFDDAEWMDVSSVDPDDVVERLAGKWASLSAG